MEPHDQIKPEHVKAAMAEHRGRIERREVTVTERDIARRVIKARLELVDYWEGGPQPLITRSATEILDVVASLRTLAEEKGLPSEWVALHPAVHMLVFVLAEKVGHQPPFEQFGDFYFTLYRMADLCPGDNHFECGKPRNESASDGYCAECREKKRRYTLPYEAE